ncbi:vesicle coat component [Gryganskiella cystojenkinii]|nr:vesicle coat component [Gryganskiella cystojenkinii]
MKKHGTGKDNKKKPAKEAPTPQTWEEYMEGERYATGDKARRFYEKAGDMYNKACKLNPEDSDCLYNLGRVLYILVDFTHSPCQKLSLLNASIERFRTALGFDGDNADTLFNLAQALTTHAEVIQDHDEDDEEEEHDHDHSHGDHDHSHGSPEERAAMELQEAISLFESCYSIQQRELYNTVREVPAEDEAEDSKELRQQELSSSAGVLIDTLISASQALTSLAFLVDTVERSHGYYQQASEKLDIALGVANDKALWPSSTEESPSSGKGKGKQAAAELIVDGEEDILPATKPVSTFREAQAKDDTVSQKEKTCDIHLQYSNLLSSQTDRNYQDTGKISEELYEKSLQHLDIVLSFYPRHVEALCDKGDLLGAWAQGLAAFEPRVSIADIERWESGSSLGNSDAIAAEPTASSGASTKSGTSGRPAKIWQLFAQATRAFLSALEVEPQNTSILEKLGDIHWSRSLLSSQVALKNRPMLLNNASVYYRFAWESCRDGAENVDEDQRMDILLSWAQVLKALPGKDEEVIRVLKQWKRVGGTKDMLKEMLEGGAGDILQPEFVEFALKLVRKGLTMTRKFVSATLAISFLLLASTMMVQAIKFDLPGMPEGEANHVCVSHYVDENTEVVVKVKVGPGPQQKVSIEVNDDSVHQNQFWRKDGLTDVLQKGTFLNKEAGDVVACFTNTLASGYKPDPRYSRAVDIEFEIGSETIDYEKLAETEKLKPMELALRKLEDNVKDILENMEHLQQREETMRNTNESTNARVQWFSTMTMFVLIALGAWQILYLKQFFRKKRLID